MFEPNPFETQREMAGGYCLSRGLHVVADLGVADKLDENPRTAGELAVLTGAHAEALARVLRLLSAHGVFEACEGKFRHSPASRMLRTDHPLSMRDYVRMFGLPPFWATFGEMEQSVRTGLPMGDKVPQAGSGRISHSTPKRMSSSTRRWWPRRRPRSPAFLPPTTSRSSS